MAETTEAQRKRGRPKGSRNKRTSTQARSTQGMRARGRTHSGVRQIEEQPGGLIAQTRAALADRMGACTCNCCDHKPVNRSAIAKEIGLSSMTVRKYLEGGSVSAGALDRIHAYLNK